jgi:hypothetical protein
MALEANALREYTLRIEIAARRERGSLIAMG